MASISISHSRKRAPPRPAVSERALRNTGYNKPWPGWPAGKDSSVNRISLLTWHELPTWQQDNEFILTGYRTASGSFSQSMRSLRHIHNETVNIYSHLFGGILFTILPFYVYSTVYPRYSNVQLADIVVFSTFFFGVAVCFFLSASFHTVANHSETVAALGNQLDYMGVVVLMWGSTIPSVYYGFYCDLELQKLYWSVVSVLAIACIATTLNPKFRHPRLRPYRAAMYSGLGLSAIVFIIHGLLLHGWELQNRRMSLSWMGLMGALNLIGAAAYAARVGF
ncbi:related to membrane proteins, contain hemolysin III domain [Rhynchosporium graminicola]|uniref:Related to membrane proteins, contain hemolysin III domain n=1 Tax=Rhynchosporium graminicola TaxID=2792576 RepID=A0A1E1LB67_9HELO|nr:related to membrane proteins, contain hemolysin III domain [Rhynchosporium commune]